MITEVFFDVETQKLFSEITTFNPADLGVSIVSVLTRQLDDAMNVQHEKMQSFWEKDLPAMWSLFEGVDRIIGFNSINFDVPTLAPYAPANFPTLAHFDILAKVKDAAGKRLSLNELARHTLGAQKTDVGVNAVYYFKSGDPEKLKKLREYCEADVYLTRDLYDYGRTHGHLKFSNKWNTMETIPVDFSYPKPTAPSPQMGLF